MTAGLIDVFAERPLSGNPLAVKSLQKFASVHANIHNHFNLERHLVDRQTYKERRSATLAEWRAIAG